MGARSTFTWEPGATLDNMVDGLIAQTNSKREAVFATLKGLEPQVEAWMKANAPWTDRTGAARSSLAGFAQDIAHNNMVLWFLYGRQPNRMAVPYAIYLESRWAGRYSVIAPGVDHFFPIVMSAVRRVMGQGVFVSGRHTTGGRSSFT